MKKYEDHGKQNETTTGRMAERSTKMKIRNTLVLLGVLLVAGNVHTQAAVMIFSDYALVPDTAQGGVLKNGDYVVAQSVGDLNDREVNGLTFLKGWNGTTLLAATANGVSIQVLTTDAANSRTVNAPDPAFSDAGLQGMLTDGARSSSGAGEIRINITGLTFGQEYQLQGFVNLRSLGARTLVLANNDDISGNRKSLAFPDDKSYHWTATWTADKADQTLWVLRGGDGATRSMVHGLSLQAIPEPATLGLFAMAMGGLLCLRRRFV